MKSGVFGFGSCNLNPARLPIPPPSHVMGFRTVSTAATSFKSPASLALMRRFLSYGCAIAPAVILSLFSGCGSNPQEGGASLVAFSADTAESQRRHVYTNLADGTMLRRVSAEYVPQVGDSFAWRPRAAELSILGNEPGSPSRRLFLAVADGTAIRDVMDDAGAQSSALESEWSPDGTHIALQVWGASIETSEVYICAAPDFECVKANEPIDETGGAWLAGWSPDGRRLAYVAQEDELSPQELFTCAADGSDDQRINRDLQEGSNVSPHEVAWSPDGRWLAYEAYQETYGLYVGAADGSSNHRVSSSDTSNVEQWAWRPDGARIAFLEYGQGRLDLLTNLPDGSEPVRVSEQLLGQSAVWDFRWSPDGTRFAYVGGDEQAISEVFLELHTCMADGSNDRVIKEGGASSEFDWNPNGDLLAFTWTNPASAIFELYTSKPDGSEVTQIGDSIALAPFPGAFDLAWSPNGARLAFVATLEPSAEIGLFTASPDGSDLAGVGSRTPEGIRHQWSPDGARIAYVVVTDSSTESRAAIFTNAPDGSDERQVNDPEEPLQNIWSFSWGNPR